MWGSSAPDIVVLSLRTARGVVAGARILGLYYPGIDECRQFILLLSGLGDAVHIGGVVPGHEYLGSTVGGTEHLLPCTLSLAAAGFPGFERLGQQTVAMGRKPVGQRFGYLALVGRLGEWTVVAGMTVESDFVLHLYHDDGLLLGVHLF